MFTSFSLKLAHSLVFGFATLSSLLRKPPVGHETDYDVAAVGDLFDHRPETFGHEKKMSLGETTEAHVISKPLLSRL